MAKTKTTFFCRSCGYESAKWIGRCPSCNSWNSFVEEVVVQNKNTSWSKGNRKEKAMVVNLKEITSESAPRLQLSDEELNLVLGGGVVPGSVILLGGEPGIGKSTLLLQIAAQSNYKVMYASGEESAEQIKLRADRIGHLQSQCLVVAETLLENIMEAMDEHKPEIVIIDSIQTMHSDTIDNAPGSIVQIRECTAKMLQYAKENNVPVFLIGHITKDGSIAGPKLLEHMVDTVLQFEGDRQYTYRVLRNLKNRFGSTNEMGIYSMNNTGLEPVKNPSEILLAQREEHLSGIAVGCAMEGLRPLLLEIQSLVSTAVYGTPQRSSTAFDLRRLNMLLAVLEKRCGFRLGQQDVFVNIAGGIRLEDPALDLAVMAAVMSSYQNISLPQKTVFAAEVGLSGEIRAVQRVDQRISEAQKLGFEEIVISRYNKIPDKKYSIKIKTFSRVDEVFSWIFG
ncbi:MAG: DNA repair protein RadA [Bacteroidetes bacterium]|nr:DNA repair protein RadA [Bacteroidota bacterium]